MDAHDPPPPVARDSQPVARNSGSAKKYGLSDYLFQFITITAGVLIALLVNGFVELRDTRALVRQARDTIAREISDNRNDLQKTMADFDKDAQGMDKAITFANEMLVTKKTDITELLLHVNLADLSSTAWRSAERTGALSHMDYAEVQRLSRVYDHQDIYVLQQRGLVDQLTAASALLTGEFNPDDPNPKDLELFRQQVMRLRASLKVLEDFAKRLAEDYAEILK